jgi:DNA-directed RNA polymerase subunit alpha
MLDPIYLPERVEIKEEDKNAATFTIYPYHPGYGPTVANAIRRVLLSSLPGAAITHVKIEGIDHEFSTIKGVKEDIVALTMNLKKVRLLSTSDEPVELVMKIKGEKKVTAGDFEENAAVKIANPQAIIAHLTDNDSILEMRCVVERGRGYVPSETREREEREIGMIMLDAIYTPVERVSFRVENVRVGQATDYHKLIMTIATDGTITPKEALQQAAAVLADHFKELSGDYLEKLTAERPAEVKQEGNDPTKEEEPENTLHVLQLPSRVHNALERVGITAVEQVLELPDEQIQDIPGLGEKAVKDIMEARERFRAEAGKQS